MAKAKGKTDSISATADQEKGELDKIKHRRILSGSAGLLNDLRMASRSEKHSIWKPIKRQ
jgi:hypothetical protein